MHMHCTHALTHMHMHMCWQTGKHSDRQLSNRDVCHRESDQRWIKHFNFRFYGWLQILSLWEMKTFIIFSSGGPTPRALPLHINVSIDWVLITQGRGIMWAEVWWSPILMSHLSVCLAKLHTGSWLVSCSDIRNYHSSVTEPHICILY